MKIMWGPSAFKALNGVFCVYKPKETGIFQVMRLLRSNLINDLNRLPCYKHEVVQNEGVDVLDGSVPVPSDAVQINNDHRLVLGPRYHYDDLTMGYLHTHNFWSSGVLIVGIGSGCHTIKKLQLSNQLRVYHVKGVLGKATLDFSPNGPLMERSSYYHVKRGNIDKVCAAAQSNHQKQLFTKAGVHPDSQEAYNLASRGLLRPSSIDSGLCIYKVRCIHFDRPHFTLEVHCINEVLNHLMALIHDIGVYVRSGAYCEHIHRLRDGHFSLNHTLLRRDWHLPEILKNIDLCKDLVTDDRIGTGPWLKAPSLSNHSQLTENHSDDIQR